VPLGNVNEPVPSRIKLLGIAAVPELKVTRSPAASPKVILPVALNELKKPVLGVTLPIGPGDANLAVNPAPQITCIDSRKSNCARIPFN
jgi:hypothetical protein